MHRLKMTSLTYNWLVFKIKPVQRHGNWKTRQTLQRSALARRRTTSGLSSVCLCVRQEALACDVCMCLDGECWSGVCINVLSVWGKDLGVHVFGAWLGHSREIMIDWG
jgi:hypothetical protein